MKRVHRHEVSALAAVVRAAFDDLAAHGRRVPDDALVALAQVEAWLDGADVGDSALQAAADASHEEGVPSGRREQDRALLWARTAAGNLAWMARKDRGWQGADASILDAATYALSSLGVPGVRDRAAFETLRTEALARARTGPSRPERPRRAKPERADLSALIGAAATERLARREPVFAPEARGDEDRLRALLGELGYPAHAAVLAYDARYGGLVVADGPGEEGYDWIFGAYACLRSGAHTSPRGGGSGAVPIAYSPNDVVFFMDEDGAVSAIDTIADLLATPYAASGDEMMRRLLEV